MHDSYLRYRNGRWWKIASGLVVVALAAYAIDRSPDRGGATPVGLALGVVATTLMLWLTWFGVRKRRYQPGGAPLRGWLSAHVYLGVTLLLLVPLHCAFRFGWNIHTLAYLLMTAVILSGMIGVAIYTVVPERMTQNRPGERLSALFEQVGALDAESKTVAAALPTSVATAVASAIDRTRIGGSWWRQLRGGDPSRPTTRALGIVQTAVSHEHRPADLEALQRLLETLAAKRVVLERLGRDVQLKALLDLWLVLHVPLALASLAAVAAHVVVVLYFR